MPTAFDVFREVNRTTQAQLRTLVQGLRKTLQEFGCAGRSPRDFAVFDARVRLVILKLIKAEPVGVEVRGGDDRRRYLMGEFLGLFGADEEDVEELIKPLLSIDAQGAEAELFNAGTDRRKDPSGSRLNDKLGDLWKSGQELHSRLAQTLRKVGRPYRGTVEDPDEGIEQTCELLSLFPDLAQPIYESAGIRGLQAFPPQETGAKLDAKSQLFFDECDGWASDKQTWGILSAVGILVAGVVTTVLTGGLAGAGWAAVAGVTFSAGVAGTEVWSASNRLQHYEDALAFGGASSNTVEHAEGELKGAWAMAVVGTATGGLMYRAARSANALAQVFKVTALSAGSGGLATALNPNVWRSPNTTGLILIGMVVPAVAGAGGGALAHVAGRALAPMGAQLQVFITRAGGQRLKAGSKVNVVTGPNEQPVQGQVTAVSPAAETVTVTANGKSATLKVGKVVSVAKKTGRPHEQAARPRKPAGASSAPRPQVMVTPKRTAARPTSAHKQPTLTVDKAIEVLNRFKWLPERGQRDIDWYAVKDWMKKFRSGTELLPEDELTKLGANIIVTTPGPNGVVAISAGQHRVMAYILVHRKLPPSSSLTRMSITAAEVGGTRPYKFDPSVRYN